MRANTTLRQPSSVDNAKHFVAPTSQLSVTQRADEQSERFRARRVALRGAEKPSKRYARLKPWLDLANLVAWLYGGAPEPLTQDEMEAPVWRFVASARDTDDFPAAEFNRWFIQSPDRNKASNQLLRLAVDVVRVFLFCTGEGAQDDNLPFEDGPRETASVDCSSELVKVKVFDPYRDYFLPAIEGTEVRRIRRCPICSRVFYVGRDKAGSKYSSKACSKRCNSALKARKWRVDEEHRQRRALTLLQEDKDVRQIAKILKVATERVRGYLARERLGRGGKPAGQQVTLPGS